jgi:hypothetical protein
MLAEMNNAKHFTTEGGGKMFIKALNLVPALALSLAVVVGAAGSAGAAAGPATTTCAMGGTCALGDIGPGGGIVFVVASSPQPWGTYMEAALTDLIVPGDPIPTIRWCSDTDKYVADAATGNTGSLHTSIAIGAGWPNTVQMSGNCDFGAANAVRTYHGGGKSDWFVPSIDEFHAMCIQKTVVNTLRSAYWTSSESPLSSGQALIVGVVSAGECAFDKPAFRPELKSSGFRIRPARAF